MSAEQATAYLQRLTTQIGRDYNQGQPTHGYAADTLTGLLDEFSPARFARTTCLQVISHEQHEQRLHAPLAQTLNQWWLSSLAAERRANDTGIPDFPASQIPDLHHSELTTALDIFGDQSPVSTPIIQALATLHDESITASLRTNELFSNLTLRAMEDEDISPPVFRTLQHVLVQRMPDIAKSDPLTFARIMVPFAAQLGNDKLQHAVGQELHQVTAAALIQLAPSVYAQPGTEILKRALATHTRPGIITTAQQSPAQAWGMIDQQRHSHKENHHGALSADQLPLRDVALAHARQNVEAAAEMAALEIVRENAPEERRPLLAMFQSVADQLQPLRGVLYLAALHQHMAFEDDLIKPSRAVLVDHFNRLTFAEQIGALDAICDRAPGDDRLRVALCNSNRENKLS